MKTATKKNVKGFMIKVLQRVKGGSGPENLIERADAEKLLEMDWDELFFSHIVPLRLMVYKVGKNKNKIYYDYAEIKKIQTQKFLITNNIKTK